MPRFIRQVIVQVGKPGRRGLSVEGLRVSFDVERSLSSDPNKATIAVYNPAPATVKAFQEPGAVVRLLAGYDEPALVFVGDVDRAHRRDQGVDRVLVVEAQDGGRRFRESVISQTFPPGATLRDIVDAVAETLSIPRGTVRGVPRVTYAEGLTVTGRSADVLSALLRQGGIKWSVQDGELTILAPGESTPETVPLLSPETGLVGSPEAGEDTLDLTALLTPEIRPGRRFRLVSRDYDGIYRAERVQHIGDSGWESTFHTRIEAVEA